MRYAVCCAFLSAALAAQEVVWERTGQPEGSYVGRYAKFMGDVNGDGFDDLVTRVDRWSPGFAEELAILSGRDGSTLLTQPRPAGNQTFFDSWDGAGDMDGDGIPDYVFAFHENQSKTPGR